MGIEYKLQQLLDSFGESEVVEFKEAKNAYDFNKLGKYFSALSNEANLKGLKSAWLVFGVKNDQTVVCSQFRTDMKDLQSLKKEVADKITSRLTFVEIHEVHHANGRVILFEIPAAPQGFPVAWDGHYFGRDGESLGPLNLEEIERIRAQNRVYDWSAEICQGASIRDLDEEAIKVARREYTTKHSRLAEEIQAWDDNTFLNKAKLTINGQVTRTAISIIG